MKKRSILSAVAMLLVSALVLTSATYAWFASGSSASVTAVSASVSASDGSLLISADGGTTWDTSAAMGTNGEGYADYGSFTAATLKYPGIGTATAGELTPVSCAPNATEMKFMDGTINGTAFSSSAVTGGYVQFSIKVKSTADATITVTPAFATAIDYGYCYCVVNGTGKLFGVSAARPYTPIAYSASTVTGTDSNGNSIMDDGDSAKPVLAAEQTTVAQSATTITATANTVYDVIVYMWAEGNDATCTGATGGALSCGLTFGKTAPTP